MKDYTVSVCIVTYNSKNIIERTISSILEQTKGVQLDFYVVDNASSDGTADFGDFRGFRCGAAGGGAL